MNIYLGKVPFNKNYNHVVDFATYELQHDYFSRLGFFATESTYNGVRYIRENETIITLQIPIEDLLIKNYNYLILEYYNFKVEGLSRITKRRNVYYFIERMFNDSPTSTNIVVTTDVWQTNLFVCTGQTTNPMHETTPIMSKGISIKDSLVLREHQDRWTYDSDFDTYYPIWSYTLENVDKGEMIVRNKTKYVIKDTTGILNRIRVYMVLFLEGEGVGEIKTTYLGGTIVNKTKTGLLQAYFFDYEEPTSKILKIYDPTAGDYKTISRFKDISLSLFEDTLQINPFNNKCIKIVELQQVEFDITVEETTTEYKLKICNSGTTTALSGLFTTSQTYHATGGDVPMTVVMAKEITLAPKTVDYIRALIETDSMAFSYTRPAMPSMEPKLKCREFNYYIVTSSKMENLVVNNEYILEDVALRYMCSMDIWLNEQVYVEQYKGDNNGIMEKSRYKNNNELVIMNDAYINYLINNRTQIQNTQIMNMATAGMSATMIGAGIGLLASGHLMAGGGMLLGGINTAINSTKTVTEQLAKEADYKTKADDIKTSANTYMLDNQNDAGNLWKYEYGLTDEYYYKIFNYLLRYGYKVNACKIPTLDSRYYYNYIKCSYVELDNTLIEEAEYRAYIETILINGTTIWHYRNPDTFLFLDYSKENVEMTLIGD